MAFLFSIQNAFTFSFPAVVFAVFSSIGYAEHLIFNLIGLQTKLCIIGLPLPLSTTASCTAKKVSFGMVYKPAQVAAVGGKLQKLETP